MNKNIPHLISSEHETESKAEVAATHDGDANGIRQRLEEALLKGTVVIRIRGGGGGVSLCAGAGDGDGDGDVERKKSLTMLVKASCLVARHKRHALDHSSALPTWLLRINRLQCILRSTNHML